jgi:hypothetical protein
MKIIEKCCCSAIYLFILILNRKLLEQEAYTDVNFEFPADGASVRAHRAILSVRSPVGLQIAFELFF